MERRAAREFDDETLELIDVLNFENWMYCNKELVGVLYEKPMNSVQLHTFERLREGPNLYGLLNKGVEFGILTRDKKMGPVHLTDRARKFYEEHLKEDSNI